MIYGVFTFFFLLPIFNLSLFCLNSLNAPIDNDPNLRTNLSVYRSVKTAPADTFVELT